MSVGVCLVCVYRRIPWYPIRIRLGYETCVEYDRIHVSSDTRVQICILAYPRISEDTCIRFCILHVFECYGIRTAPSSYSDTAYPCVSFQFWDTSRIQPEYKQNTEGYHLRENDPILERNSPRTPPATERARMGSGVALSDVIVKGKAVDSRLLILY